MSCFVPYAVRGHKRFIVLPGRRGFIVSCLLDVSEALGYLFTVHSPGGGGGYKRLTDGLLALPLYL